MDSVQRQLLYCLSAYRLGEKSARQVPGLTGEDWTALRKLAAAHKLGPVVFDTLRGTPGFCGEDAQRLLAWRRETLLQAAGQAARSQKITEISTQFRTNGIQHALVKGLLCRELYSRPDLRLSGDEDLFIAQADQERCHLILKENGLVFIRGDDKVAHWQDPGTGLHIELHTCLFSPRREEDRLLNRVFSEQLAHTVTANVTGGAVDTLPPTYHFVFLVCHALKHFLAGGVGVRTLCDIITFAQYYREEIDIPAASALLEQVHGRLFLDQIFAAGQEWFGLASDWAGWPCSGRTDPEELLMDCLEAGIYGQTTMNRRHSAELVLGAAERRSGKSAALDAVFPPRDKLLGKYPVLTRHPALLPACWIHRLGRYGLEILHSTDGTNSPIKSVKLGKKRTEMMIKYGILPKNKTKD